MSRERVLQNAPDWRSTVAEFLQHLINHRRLSPQECSLLLQAARTPLERVSIWLLATTGLRRGEVLGLDLTDVSTDGSELRVLGKGNVERTVPVP